MNERCLFCGVSKKTIFYETEQALAVWDGFPVSPGHALLIPKSHIQTWFDATADDQQALISLINPVKRLIEETHSPSGYNIGINSGEAAGQTVAHLHIHVIPRYEADVEDPRGGIRWVIPDKAVYWD